MIRLQLFFLPSLCSTTLSSIVIQVGYAGHLPTLNLMEKLQNADQSKEKHEDKENLRYNQ